MYVREREKYRGYKEGKKMKDKKKRRETERGMYRES